LLWPSAIVGYCKELFEHASLGDGREIVSVVLIVGAVSRVVNLVSSNLGLGDKLTLRLSFSLVK
jgi:hypothetical protein